MQNRRNFVTSVLNAAIALPALKSRAVIAPEIVAPGALNMSITPALAGYYYCGKLDGPGLGGVRTVNGKIAGVISVTDFGAKGDGVTDDAGAVQAAINAAPDGSVVLFPSGGSYLLASESPTLTGRTDVAVIAYGATLTLRGKGRQALLLTGTNTRIKWYGGRIVGSNVLADGQQAIGTLVSPPAGTITTDLLVADLGVQDVARGCYVDVSSLGDATHITYRRVMASNILGRMSGHGYGLAMSGVRGGTLEDCQVDAANRHAFYLSACDGINFSNLRSSGHLGPTCLVIARSRNIQGMNVFITGCTIGNPIGIDPHESDASADTGRIQLRNVTCTKTTPGQPDIIVGLESPSTTSVLYDVLLDGVTISRPSTETASGVESILINHGTDITVRNVQYQASAALTVAKTVVYLAAIGGATYTNNVTITGVRARTINLAPSGSLLVVQVARGLCSGAQRLTIRDNEGMVGRGSAGQAVIYDAARTNPEIEARFNRVHDALTGTATLVRGTVTISSREILAGDWVRLTHLAASGTIGVLSLGTIIAHTRFVINSSSALDASTVLWEIVH